jgi:ABC-type multidrug transport system fused ATPase/permease subunit
MTTLSEQGAAFPPRAGAPSGSGGSGTPSEPGRWAVEVRGLTKRFGTRTAVDAVDLLVPRGSAFGYLGPNGAGKTTLIRVLLGLTRADSGTISLLGRPVPGERARALARVGAIVDEARFHGHLTGRENLKILAAARAGMPADRSARRSSAPGWPSAPTTRSPPTPWACASASAWPLACWPTPSCSSSTSR